MLILTDPIQLDHVGGKSAVLGAQQATPRDHAGNASCSVGTAREADEVDTIARPILAHDLSVAVNDALADAATEGSLEQLDEAAGISRNLRSGIGAHGGKYGLRAADFRCSG